jgi:NAD(P)-dependent dehydrogenase (short-subunit alcohol dehydrogenase family)
MNDMFDLTEKVAIITGSTRGIGRAIAEAFLAAGASVIVSNEDAAETRAVAEKMGAHGICCDVTDAASLSALVVGTTGFQQTFVFPS